MPRKPLADLLKLVADNTDQQITPGNIRTVVTELYKAIDADGSTELPTGYTPTKDGQVVTKKFMDDNYPPITEADFVKNDGTTGMPATYTPTDDEDVATKVYADNAVPDTLDDLTDVDLSTPPTDAQALRFDDPSKTWKPGSPVPDMKTVTNTVTQKVNFQGALTSASPPPGATVWNALPAPGPTNKSHYWVCLDTAVVPAGVPDIAGQSYDEGAWLYSDGAHFILISGNAMRYTEAHERFGFMAHNAAKAYKADTNVSHNNGLYRCKTDIAAKAWDPTDWEEIIHVPQSLLELSDIDVSGGINDGDTLIFDNKAKTWGPTRLDHASHFMLRNPKVSQTVDSADDACIMDYNKIWVPRTGSITLAVGERIDDPALWVSGNQILMPWSETGTDPTDRPWTQGDMCAYQNQLYYCLNDIAKGDNWDASHWRPITLPLNRIVSFRPPSATGDPGDLGEVAYDPTNFYIRTNTGWKKAALADI